MEDLFAKISNIYAKNGLNDLVNSNEEKKLLYLYCFYHYYYGDDDCIYEISDHCKYSKQNDNFVQAVFEEDNFEDKILDVLMPYYVDDNHIFSKETIRYMVSQTQGLIFQMQNKRYSTLGNESLLREYIDGSSEYKIMMRIITNYNASFDEKEDFQKYASSLSQDEKISIEIVFKDDIEDEIAQLTSNKKYVEYGELTIDAENNYLTYGKEKSLIVNITATSLRDMYIKYGKAGLFSMNLRFFVPNKKVDAGIENTIRNEGNEFWYLNNGIIIVCDDYKIEERCLKLNNFSIVNGGQTTKLIGVIPFSDDFVISCKVIRNKYIDNTEEGIKFVSKVAEASNTQKPINSTDIIANRYEQRLLKSRLEDLNIFMQIKRGESTTAYLKENYPYPWQRTKNTEIGQMIYASICQKPGTARNSKDKIFSDPRKYKSVFGDLNYDMNILKDLLYFKAHFAKWSNAIKKESNADEYKKGLVRNGFLFFLASFVLMAKFAFSTDLTEFLKTCGPTTEKGNYVISQRTFDHRLFNKEFDALQNPIYEVFELIYEKYILKVFRNLKELRSDLVYSNFTKTDSNYINNIVLEIYDDFAYDINNRVARCLANLLYVENEEDKEKTKQLVDNAIVGFETRNDRNEEEQVDLITEELTNRLKDYRSRTYKEKRVRPYEVFTNKELNSLVKLRPRSIEEIEKFNCFSTHPRTKCRLYGEDIVNIIISITGDKE